MQAGSVSAIPQPDGSLALRQPTCWDRSYEYGTPIGIKGRQRGISTQKMRMLCCTLAFRSISLLINALSQTDNQHFGTRLTQQH